MGLSCPAGNDVAETALLDCSGTGAARPGSCAGANAVAKSCAGHSAANPMCSAGPVSMAGPRGQIKRSQLRHVIVAVGRGIIGNAVYRSKASRLDVARGELDGSLGHAAGIECTHVEHGDLFFWRRM